MDKLVERWVAIPQQQRYAAVVGIVVLIVGGYWYLFHSSATETLAKLNRDKLELVQKRRSVASVRSVVQPAAARPQRSP